MANVDRPHGFLAIGTLNGADPAVRFFVKAAADATLLGIGDFVEITGALNTVGRAETGDDILGSTTAYGAASKLTDQPVNPAFADTIFEGQETGTAATLGTASEGLNANFVVADANSTTGISQMEIDSDTEATTATLDLKLWKVAPYADNDGTLANSRWFVLVNRRLLSDQSTGV